MSSERRDIFSRTPAQKLPSGISGHSKSLLNEEDAKSVQNDKITHTHHTQKEFKRNASQHADPIPSLNRYDFKRSHSATDPTFTHMASLGLVTPPSSSTECNPHLKVGERTGMVGLSEGSPSPNSRSFSARRSHVPKPLDVAALRRERQFSGPYSAIPLLSQKRSVSEMEKSDSTHSDADSDKEEDLATPGKTKHMHLPQISPAPYVSHKLSHIQSRFVLPSLKSSFLPGEEKQSISPSTSSHTKGASHPSEFCQLTPKNITKLNNLGSPLDSDRPLYTSASHRTPDNDYASRRTTKSDISAASERKAEKKAKFLRLCESIWDLIQDD